MTITTRLTLSVSLLAGLLLAGMGYAGSLLDEHYTERAAMRHARTLATVLRTAAETDLSNHGRLGAIADTVAHQGAATVVFFGPDARATAPVPTEEDPVVRAQIQSVIERKQPSEDLFRLGDSSVYVYRLPLLDGHQRSAGALELRLELGDAARQASWLRSGGVLIAALLALFATLVGLVAWYALGRPIAQLMDGMDHVIRGDLTHVLPLGRRAEIGKIAYRFNEMTARLRAAQDEVEQGAEAKLQLEGRVRRSEKLAAIGQLSAEIAHEVGTPLNVIGGRAQAIQRKADQPHEARKNAQIIAEQVSRITKIIEQVLDLGRAPAPTREPIDLGRIVGDAITYLQDQLQRIEVSVQLAPNLPQLIGDPDGLQQVVLNLLQNAIQAMPEGGSIRIDAEAVHRRKEGLDLAPPQSYVAISVRDSGSGIPDQHLSRIFDPFFSTKAKGEGTGLGLTVVHGIVKTHDGWIDVRPADPRGTIVTVFLPAERDEAAVEPITDGA